MGYALSASASALPASPRASVVRHRPLPSAGGARDSGGGANAPNGL